MSFRDILMSIAILVNGANGHAALHLSRELCCAYKTAFVLAHKIHEVLGTLQTPRKLTGIVEIDGKWVGGHQKKFNLVKDRQDMRRSNPKRRTIVTMRERRPNGRTLSFVFRGEHEAIATVLANVHTKARIRTDEAAHWNILHGYYADVKTVNHSKEGFLVRGVHTNWVEGFNSRIRRAEFGVHHHICGPHLKAYADEFAWREDHRRVSNGSQFAMVLSAAARQPRSYRFVGYWRERTYKYKPANDNPW
jgi:hypothetical protein